MSTVEQEQKGLPSASEMHRVVSCPGYLPAKRSWQRRPESGDAVTKVGQDIHDILANEDLFFNVDGDPIEFDNLNLRSQWITRKCAEILAGLKAEFIGNPVKTWVENRWFMYAAKADPNKPIATAKPDVVMVNGSKTWLILDYKTGPKPVPDASANWQIAAAAACIAGDDPLIQQFDMDVVYGVIIQPLVTLKPKVVSLRVQDVFDLRSQIMRSVRLTETPHQPRIPGTHCDYCPISHLCLETQSMLPILQKRSNKLQHLTPQQLFLLHGMIGPVRKRCDEVSAYIKSQLEAYADAIPGLSLEKQSSGHEVSNISATLGAVQPVLSKPDFWGAAKISTAKLRDDWTRKFAEQKNITIKAAEAAWKDQVLPTLTPKDPRVLIKRHEQHQKNP